jgi:hypothetical protein
MGLQIYQSIIEYKRYMIMDPVRNISTYNGILVKKLFNDTGDLSFSGTSCLKCYPVCIDFSDAAWLGFLYVNC